MRVLGLCAAAAALAAPTALAGGPAVGPPLFRGWHGDTLASANWAGYAVTSPDATHPAAFTNVTATWTEPSSVCGQADGEGSAAFWIGIGGYNQGSRALEQIGTLADCDAAGPTSYAAWYELVPGPAISFAMKIKPGDTVNATVSVSTTNIVTMTLRNLTRHTTASVRQKDVAPDLSSAEWIAEAPTLCFSSTSCSVTTLPNFGSVAMSKIKATAAGWGTGSVTYSAWQATPIQIAALNGPEAGTCRPTGLAADGSAFTVAWNASAQPGC